MNNIVVDHKPLEKQFLEHLELHGNHRILFTAPFGQGKTTFLNEVFKETADKYYTIKLYPVNYSVSANEDVFELIKFDILVQLIGKYKENISLQKEDFSLLLTSQVYIRDRLNVVPWIQAILAIFGQIGKSAKDFLTVLSDTVKDFNEFQNEIEIDEIKDINDYLKKIEDQSGSPYEMDYISHLIYDFVQRLKNSPKDDREATDDSDSKLVRGSKETVLVIDDLDRLDPDHIFRLFNIFSAHFDDVNAAIQHNKFGFDKVIFVCDIDNIRRIYRHRYGTNVDFKGYLDKFYSYLPFDFDNREFINRKVREIMANINIDSSTQSSQMFSHCISPEMRNEFYAVFRWLLICLVNSKIVNLRTIVASSPISIPDIQYGSQGAIISTTDYPVLWIFHFVKTLMSTWDLVHEKLTILKSMYTSEKSHRSNPNESYMRHHEQKALISYCVPFLVDRAIMVKRFVERDDPKFAYSRILSCYLHYDMVEGNSGGNIEFKFNIATKLEATDSERISLNPYEVLSLTFEECKKAGFLE